MRSKLFIPASRPDLYAKGLAGAADSLSFDLEDAVAEDRKTEARQQLALALGSAEFAASPKIVIVRINALTTAHFAADLACVAHTRVDLVNVPKIESAADVLAVVAALEKAEAAAGLSAPRSILANIESPRGVRLAAEIAAAHPRVLGLQLGFADLLEPLGIDRTDTAAIHHLQLSVRLAAGESGRWAYDAAYGAVKDADGFRAEAIAAKRLGFLGKTCIHPSQVPIANEVFRPSEAELAQARRIVAAADEAEKNGIGVFTVDGRMIDAPFIRRARVLAALPPVSG